MKAKVLILLLLAASAMFAATRVSVGVYVGGGYGPAYYAAPCPGPDYVWVPGYWTSVGPRPYWSEGYWAPPRYRGWYHGRRYRGYGRYDRFEHGYRGERNRGRWGRWDR
ncbi:MAG TPA: hypothetical protein VF767_03640 [Bryobacteraceae bacterium]